MGRQFTFGNESDISAGNETDTAGNDTRNPDTDTEPRTGTDADGNTETEKISVSADNGYSINIPAPATQKKPRAARKTTTKKPALDKNIAENLTIGISGLFAVTAELLKADYIAVTTEEAQSIATPAAKILARYSFAEQLDKYSDGMALIIAAGIITIPRFAMYNAEHKVKEVKKIAYTAEPTAKGTNPVKQVDTGNNPAFAAVSPDIDASNFGIG